MESNPQRGEFNLGDTITFGRDPFRWKVTNLEHDESGEITVIGFQPCELALYVPDNPSQA